jgi:hypothetical protein
LAHDLDLSHGQRNGVAVGFGFGFGLRLLAVEDDFSSDVDLGFADGIRVNSASVSGRAGSGVCDGDGEARGAMGGLGGFTGTRGTLTLGFSLLILSMIWASVIWKITCWLMAASIIAVFLTERSDCSVILLSIAVIAAELL